MQSSHVKVVQYLLLATTLSAGIVYAQTDSGINCDIAIDSGKNIIIGTDGNDAICAQDEDCTKWADQGYDVQYSTDGDDFVCPGRGNDYVNTGDGDDDIWVDNFRTRPDKRGIVGENGFKTLIGGNGDDSITDARNSAYIVGGCGRDVLEGGNGNDTIYGGTAPNDGDQSQCDPNDWDQIFGEGGNDVIVGGTGMNRLDGGPGYNYCDGSTGDTLFAPGCELCWGSGPKRFGKKLNLSQQCDNLRPNPAAGQ